MFKKLSVIGVVVAVAFLFMSSPVSGAELVVGKQVPDFSATDHNGNTVKLSDHQGKTVVLEWINPDCPYVKRHYKKQTMTSLSKKYGEDIVWLAVNSTHYQGQAENKTWVESQALPYLVLNDQKGEIGKMYGAKTTPHMFIISGDRALLYQGAIDDDPRGNSSEVLNYVDAALSAVQEGKQVAVASTKPYGCSVKYAG